MKVSKLPIILAPLALCLFCQPLVSFSSEDTNAGKEESASMEKVQKEMSETMESISRYSVKQRDQAMAAAREELAELEGNIDSLQEDINGQWDQLSDAAKDQWGDTLAALQEKRIEASEWYGKVKHSSADAWDEMKQGYVAAISELKQAWKKASEEYTAEKTN